MDIFAYIQALISAATPTAYTCLGILGFFALSVLWEMLHGLRRGYSRQITHTVFMLASAVIAFLLAGGITSRVFGELSQKSMEEVFALAESSGTAISEEVRGLITSFDTETLQYLLALPLATVVVPVLFAVLFVVINLILKLISLLVCSIVKMKKGGGVFHRLGGLVVGAVEGALVAAIILLPVAGITSSLDGAVATMREKESNPELVAMYDEAVKPISECPILPLINTYGGNVLMTHFATVYIDGEPCDLRDELVFGVELYCEIIKLSGVDLKELTAGDKDTIDALVDTLGGSDYMLILASGILRGLAYSADDGYLPLTAEPPFDKLIDPFLKVFEDSNKENLGGDLATLKEVIFVLSDEGVFTAIESGDSTDLSDAFTSEDENGRTVIRRVIDILTANSHTRPLVATLTEISVAMLCESMGLDGETAELYDNVKDGVKEVLSINSEGLTEEEYVAEVSSSLNEILTENNINVEPEIVDSMAQYINDNHKDLESISDDEINDVLLSYYDSYLEYIKSNSGDDGSLDGDGNIDDGGITQ